MAPEVSEFGLGHIGLTKKMGSDTVIPIEVLDDLCSRFIINVPEVERKDVVRICFQIEQAHWFYIDFYSKKDNFQKSRKLVNLKEFAAIVFKHVPFLHPFAERVDQVIDEWKEYKFCVPTYGAILLSEDYTSVLLVQSFSSKSSWGFPKGKINLTESPWQCAIREVKEETGFDIQEHMDPSDYLEAVINDQTVRLYIIPGISTDQQFVPKTRNEIKSVRWFPLADLPATKKEAVTKLKTSTGTVSLFMVTPFVRKLREWIAEALSQNSRKSRRTRNKSCGDIEGLELKDCISDKKKGRKVSEVQQVPDNVRPASAAMKPKKNPTELSTARQASEAETKVRRTLEYVMHQNPKIGSPVGPLDETQNKKTPNQQIRILKKPETISGKDLLTSLFNKEFSDPKSSVDAAKKSTDNSRKSGSSKDLVAESPASKSLGSIHHDRTLSSFARVSHKVGGRNYFLSHSPAVDRMKLEKILSPTDSPVKPDVNYVPNEDQKVIKFVDIPFSKSFYKHGAKAWSNFKFDRQAIIKSING